MSDRKGKNDPEVRWPSPYLQRGRLQRHWHMNAPPEIPEAAAARPISTARVSFFVDAAAKALDSPGVGAADVDTVVTISSTGIATPSLEAQVAARMGFRADVERVPVMLATGLSQLLVAPIAVALEQRVDARLLTALGFGLFALGLALSGSQTRGPISTRCSGRKSFAAPRSCFACCRRRDWRLAI